MGKQLHPTQHSSMTGPGPRRPEKADQAAGGARHTWEVTYNGGKDGVRAFEDAQALKPWVDDETVSLTPAYANDDLFLFKYVQEIDKSALVLSNDNFDDHVRAGLVTRDWLNEHTIKYMFVGSSTFLPSK
jgi:hypothetical protein